MSSQLSTLKDIFNKYQAVKKAFPKIIEDFETEQRRKEEEYIINEALKFPEFRKWFYQNF